MRGYLGWVLFLLGALGMLAWPQPAPAVAQTPTPTPEPPGPVYTVKPGDTLIGIAERFNVDLKALMEANGLTSAQQLRVGRRLLLPGLPDVRGEMTTVAVGLCEDIWSLARRYGLSVAILRRLNRLTSPGQLYPGRSLVLPQSAVSKRPLARYLVGPEETLLEAAFRTGQNPWVLLLANQKTASWQVLPGEVLLYPDAQNGTTSLNACPPQVHDVRLRPETPIQGQPWAMWWLVQPGTVAALEGTWRDRTMPFRLWDGPIPTPYPGSPEAWVGLQGVHALLRSPQVYPLEIHLTTQDGRIWRFTQPLRVVPGKYGYEELTVPPEYLDIHAVNTESRRVTALMTPFTEPRGWHEPFASPIQNGEYCFASYFGTRRNYNNGALWSYHAGLDFCAGKGTPVYAPAPGKVVLAEPLTIRGNAVILDHGWGVYTGYWHLDRIVVAPGQVVQKGDLLGYVGGTGRVTGPHLHWELWVGGVPVDPLAWMGKPWP